MKTCPFCAEQIQPDAIKCRFCGEFLQKQEQQPAGTASEADSTAKEEVQSEAERVTKELLHNWKFARWFP